MGKVFLRKKFSDYLGEERALLDIFIGNVPEPSPTPQPSVTPTRTQTPTPSITPPTPTPTNTSTLTPFAPTPSQTQTNTLTPSPTPTNPRLCTSFVATAQTINGITITQSWTGAATPYTFSPQQCCGGSVFPPSGGIYCGYGGSVICPPPIYPFDLTFDFTSGVNGIDIVIYGGGCAGGLNEEIFNFTTNAGNPTLSIIGTSCYTSITGNTVGQGIGCCAGINDTPFVRVRVNAPSNFTELVITGDGGYRGAVIGLCSDSIPFPTTPTQTPSQTATSTQIVPSVTPTQTPTSTEIIPSVTPTQTPSQTPTSTQIVPSETPTQTPSQTPTSTEIVPSVTPTMTMTPTPSGGGFNPASFGDLQVWFDANDASTFTTVTEGANTYVTEWDSKGILNYPISAETANRRPLYITNGGDGTKPAVYFQNTGTTREVLFNRGTLNMQTTSGFTMFWVGRYAGATQLSGVYPTQPAPISMWNSNYTSINSAEGITYSIRTLTDRQPITSGSTTVYSNSYTVNYNQNRALIDTSRYQLNGFSFDYTQNIPTVQPLSTTIWDGNLVKDSISQTGYTSNFSTQGKNLNSFGMMGYKLATTYVQSSTQNQPWEIFEVLVYNKPLTSVQFDQVENYLNNKWSLTASTAGQAVIDIDWSPGIQFTGTNFNDLAISGSTTQSLQWAGIWNNTGDTLVLSANTTWYFVAELAGSSPAYFDFALYDSSNNFITGATCFSATTLANAIPFNLSAGTYTLSGSARYDCIPPPPTPSPTNTPTQTQPLPSPTSTPTPTETIPGPSPTPTTTVTPSSSAGGTNYLLYETGDIMEAENGDLIEYDF